MELGLAGRVALVCGSTKGLGRAVAKALAQEGARVAVNGRHQDSVERVAQQLEAETSRTVVPLVADVGTPAEAEGMVERVARELGRLDILFCNASGPPAAPGEAGARRPPGSDARDGGGHSVGTHGPHRRARRGRRVPRL